MKTKNYWILVMMFVICGCGHVATKVRAGNILSGNESLAGIKNFELKLIMPRDEKESYGLKYEEIDKNIKLAFGAYGIKVFSDLSVLFDNMPSQEHTALSLSEETAVLHVRIDEFWPLAIGGYSYRIQISVLQFARLSRDQKIHFQAITWEDSIASLCTTESAFALKVERALYTRLDQLIKDYLAANLRQKSEEQKEDNRKAVEKKNEDKK
ncbi:MAG: hypothetical protein NTW93_01990 [Phycisphaerae bacterium]|nr:hypothetical protein [Phycisphaerae bacterium]